MSWAWQARAKATRLRSYPNIYTADQVVLDVLAYHADDAGKCRMSKARVVEACSLHESSVKRALRRLEARGYIEKHYGGGRGITNRFRLVSADETQAEGGIVSVQAARNAGLFNVHWRAAWVWLSRAMASTLPVYDRVYYPDQCILSTLAFLTSPSGATETTRTTLALAASCDYQQALHALQRLARLGYIGLTWRTVDEQSHEHLRAVLDPATLVSLDRARERGYYARHREEPRDEHPTDPLSEGQLTPFSDGLSTGESPQAAKGGQLDSEESQTAHTAYQRDADASAKGGQLDGPSDRKGVSIQESGHENGPSDQLTPFQLTPKHLKTSKKKQVPTYIVNTSNRAGARSRAGRKEGFSPDVSLGTENVSTATIPAEEAPRTAPPSAPMDGSGDEAGVAIQLPDEPHAADRGRASQTEPTAPTTKGGAERTDHENGGRAARQHAIRALEERGLNGTMPWDLVDRWPLDRIWRNIELYDTERRRRPGELIPGWLISAITRDIAAERSPAPALLTHDQMLVAFERLGGGNPASGVTASSYFDPVRQPDGTVLYELKPRGAG